MCLSADHVATIAQEVRGEYRPPDDAHPKRLAAWLREYAPTAARRLGGDGTLSPADVSSAALAAALSRPPYQPCLAEVEELRRWTFSSNPWDPASADEVEAAVERAVVWANLPPRDTARWEPAYFALTAFVRSRVAEPVRWVGYYLLGYRQPRLDGWAADQARVLASMIARTLARGTCRCAAEHDRFRLRAREAADECQRDHNLARWDRWGERLGWFVFRAAVGGVMEIGTGEGEARAWAQAFRHGMLAKVVEDEDERGEFHPLRSGVILRCPVPGCGGDIRLNNRCSQPDRHLADVREPSWWFWREGSHEEQPCRRCAKSHNLKVADVTDWLAFATRLVATADDTRAPGARVWGLLSEAAREFLRRFADERAASPTGQRLVVNDLNRLILSRTDLYARDCWPAECLDAEPWVGVFHPEDWEVLELLRQGGVDAIRRRQRQGWQETLRTLNRRLLQVAYPDLLTRFGCGRIFFGVSDPRRVPCPICGRHANWSQRQMNVWVSRAGRRDRDGN